MGTKLFGIDISYYQSKISIQGFQNAINKSGVKFVIIRLGYTGSSSLSPSLDSTFENNYSNAIKAGLPVGIYYYSLATNKQEAKKEAEFVIAHLKGKQITFPVYIDMEDSAYKQYKCSKSELAQVCDQWCKTINDAGYIAGVYASLDWFNKKIGTIVEPHTKWVAQYNSKCTYKGQYDMWQYSSSGNVAGISSRMDVNYCYKDFAKGKYPNPMPSPTAKPYTGTFPKLPTRKYFKRGDKGTQVKYLQKFLNWYGEYKLVVDGVIGSKTIIAVEKFQKAEGLDVDGLFGKQCLAKAKVVKK